MQRGIRTAVLAVALVAALLVGTAGTAAAQSGTLPAIRQATSARLALNGTITANGQSITLAGAGAYAGQSAQVDLTITLPGGSGQSLTISTIETGGKVYVRQSAAAQWQVMDLSGALMGGATGLVGFDPAQVQQLFQAASNVRPIGKTQVGGAATTEYQADIDVAKLLNLLGAANPQLGSQVGQAGNLLKGLHETLFLWVGDADQYLHQVRVLVNFDQTVNRRAVSLTEDLTVMLRDFGAAITIQAPPNAVPFNPSGGTGGAMLPGMLPGSSAGGTTAPGNTPASPGSTGAGSAGSGSVPSGGAMPGMPTTGVPTSGGVLLLGALGLLCLAVGLRLRRRPALG